MASAMKITQRFTTVFITALRLRSPSTKLLLTHRPFETPSVSYAKKLPKGAAPAVNQRKFLETEEDPVLLTSRLVGGNIMKEGEDPVLKEDSEYPEWLWDLRTEREPVALEEMSKDSLQYWKRLAKLERKKENLLKKTRNAYKYY